MQAQRPNRLALISVGLGLLCLVGALGFFRMHLASGIEPKRAVINTGGILAREGLAAGWQVPDALRAKRWHRTGARVYENGQPLPWRVEDKTAVIQEGRGRFCLEENWLWFSAGDGGSPLSNGKRYELEVGITRARHAVAAGLLFAGAWLLVLWPRPVRQSLANGLSGAGESMMKARSGLAVLCGIMAAVFFTQAVPSLNMRWGAPLLPDGIFSQPQTAGVCYPPRWIRANDYRWDHAVVLENGRALQKTGFDPGNASLGAGRFVMGLDAVRFQTPDSSNPAVNGRRYELRVPLLSPRMSLAGGAMWTAAAAWLVFNRRWRWLRDGLSISTAANAEGAAARKKWGIGCCLVAVLAFSQTLPGLAMHWNQAVQPGQITLRAGGHYQYFLPGWIRHNYSGLDNLVLVENGRALRKAALDNAGTALAPGSFACFKEYLEFQTFDASNPAVNGRQYSLRTPFISAYSAKFLGRLWAVAALFLFFNANHLGARGDSLPMAGSAPAFARRAWGVAVLALAVLKLIMVSGEEVVAADADPLAYAITALRFVWGIRDFSIPTHPSGFPMIAAITGLLGIPWRLVIELLYAAACFFMASALFPLLRNRMVCLAIYALMVWHPWSIVGFREFFAEPLLLVVFICILALAFKLLAQPVWRWRWPPFLLLGLLFFLWNWCRHEDPLVYATYALFCFLALRAERRRSGGLRETGWRSAAFLTIPPMLVFLLSAGVDLMNYQRFGIHSRSLINSPGLIALLKSLYQIKPEQELRYAPVTRQSLQAACQASPTLRRYETALLDPKAGSTIAGQQVTKIPGEFGTYLNWLLPQCLPPDRRLADQIMAQAAREIEMALKEGRLPKRRAYFPLDPHWRWWLPDLAPAFLSWCREAMYLSSRQQTWSTLHQPYLQNMFDRAAHRRAANTFYRQVLAHGVLPVPPGTFDSAALKDGQGNLLGASLLFSNAWNSGLIFNVRAQVEEWPSHCSLALFQKDKLRGSLKLPEFSGSLNTQANFTLPDTGEQMACRVEVVWIEAAYKSKRELLEQWHGPVYQLIFVLVLVLAGVHAFRNPLRDRSRQWDLAWCLLLALSGVLLRAAFYSLVEVNAGWLAVRYLRCISPIFILLVMLATVLSCGGLKAWMPGRAAALPDQGGAGPEAAAGRMDEDAAPNATQPTHDETQ